MPTSLMEKAETQKVSAQKNVYRPAISVYENDALYTVIVALPGAESNEVSVKIAEDVITIEAPFTLDLPAGSTAKYSELRLGDYRRCLEVGDRVDVDKIAATFKSGLLTLAIPKSRGAKARKVPVQTA